MAKFVKVATRAELAGSQSGKLVQAAGQNLALFNVGGNYYAIENACPHRGGPLAEGPVAGDVVTCPWHGSSFSVKTGAVLSPPADRGVKSFPVRVSGDDVEVEVD